MLTCNLQLKGKSKTECPSLMYRLFVKIKHLPLLSTVNKPFLPSTYNFGNAYTLTYRCLRICSSRTKLHNELVCLKEIFLRNGYPEDFINKCFQKFMDIHIVKNTTLTVEEKPLAVVLP